MSNGILLLRLALGTALLLQGWSKLGAQGRRDTAAFFADVGIRPAAPFAVLAGATELGVGALLIAGFLTPLAGAGAVAVLGIAVVVTSQNGYWSAGGGSEYPLVAGLSALSLVFTGAGAHSIDELFGWSTPTLATSLAAAVLAVVSATPILVRRGRELRRSASTVVAIPRPQEVM